MRKALISLACAVVVGGIALAEMKTLTLKTGRQLTGEVTETPDGYEVKLPSGVVATFSRDDVISVVDAVTPDKEYREKLAKIDPDKPQDHYQLGEWALNKGLLEIARKELLTAIELKKDYEMASLLLRQVEAKIAEAQKPPVATRPVEKNGEDGPGPKILLTDMLLSEQDIHRIRMAELKETDRTVRIEFRNDVIKRFIEMMRGREEFRQPRAADKFRRRTRLWQTLYIRRRVERGDHAMLDDIVIKSDPKFMTDFRSRVWPVVRQYCATSDCHGCEKGVGGLKFFNIAGKNEKADYTNFVILSGLMKRGRRLIDRSYPDMSLVLEFCLPPDQATYRHPKKITAAAASRKAINYRTIDQWIRSLKYPPYPEYRLTWKAPFGMRINTSGKPDLPNAETAPASGPADEPPM